MTIEFGESVKKSREELGLNQSKLCELTSLAPSTISGIESGKMNPSQDTVRILAQALNILTEQLARFYLSGFGVTKNELAKILPAKNPESIILWSHPLEDLKPGETLVIKKIGNTIQIVQAQSSFTD